MANFGKSIRIYLQDGSVTGIRIGEVVNQTIQALACPRRRLDELKDYPETEKPSIYFLFGVDGNTGRKKAYIGEGDNGLKRVLQHRGEDYWNEAVFFVSKDENLTKAHVRCLESKAIQQAKYANRYIIENDKQSQPASLPRADKDAMEEFFLNIKLLLGTMGYLLLEEVTTSLDTSKERQSLINDEKLVDVTPEVYEYSLANTRFNAKAVQTDEGFVVLKGSEASKTTSTSLLKGYQEKRDMLITDGTLLLNGNMIVFSKSCLFTSSSQAAAIITGHSVSGPMTWKDKFGRSLKEIEEQRLKSLDDIK